MRMSAAICGSLGAAALIAIAGCSPQQAGAVAVVGDDRLTDDEVRSEVDALAEQLPDEMELSEDERTNVAADTVGGWVMEQVLEAIAQDDGLDYSRAALDTKIEEMGGPEMMAANGIGPDAIDSFAKFQILLDSTLPADEESEMVERFEEDVREQGAMQGFEGDELDEFTQQMTQQMWPQARQEEVQQRVTARVGEQMESTDVDVSGRYGIYDEETMMMYVGASASATAGLDPDVEQDVAPDPFGEMMEQQQGASGE